MLVDSYNPSSSFILMTSVLILLIFITLLIGFITPYHSSPLLIPFQLIRRKRALRMLKELYANKGAEVTTSSLSIPNLSIKYPDKEIMVTMVTGGRYTKTEVVGIIKYLPINFRMCIVREGTFQKMLKKLGYKEIEIGSDTFDDKFIIRGDDPNFVIRLLDYEIQERLLDIERLSPIISIDGSKISIMTFRIPRGEEIKKMMDAVTSIADKMMEIFS